MSEHEGNDQLLDELRDRVLDALAVVDRLLNAGD